MNKWVNYSKQDTYIKKCTVLSHLPLDLPLMWPQNLENWMLYDKSVKVCMCCCLDLTLCCASLRLYGHCSCCWFRPDHGKTLSKLIRWVDKVKSKSKLKTFYLKLWNPNLTGHIKNIPCSTVSDMKYFYESISTSVCISDFFATSQSPLELQSGRVSADGILQYFTEIS